MQVSSSTNDRVSPTSILGFPEEVDDYCGNEHEVTIASPFHPIFEHLQHPLAEEPQVAVAPQVSTILPTAVAAPNCPCPRPALVRSSTPRDTPTPGAEEIIYSRSFDPFLTDKQEGEDLASSNLQWLHITGTDCAASTNPTYHQIPGAPSIIVQAEERTKFRPCIPSKSTATTRCTTTTATSTTTKRVVFNETMEVRYFRRSAEEIFVMQQCAADRRIQQEARRLRRRQLEDMREAGVNVFDERDVYHCGVQFQRPDEDGDDEEAISTASNRAVRQRKQRGANVLQDVVDDITDMFSGVKKGHDRRQSDEVVFAQVDTATTTPPKSFLESARTSTLLLLLPTRGAAANEEEAASNTCFPVQQNEEEDPWLLSALRCSGGKLER